MAANDTHRLIRLADNPEDVAGRGPGGETMADQTNKGRTVAEQANKGRTVRGPRTKLTRGESWERSLSDLAKAVELQGNVLGMLVKHMEGGGAPLMSGGGFPPAEDPMDQDPLAVPMQDEQEDELHLAGGFAGDGMGGGLDDFADEEIDESGMAGGGVAPMFNAEDPAASRDSGEATEDYGKPESAQTAPLTLSHARQNVINANRLYKRMLAQQQARGSRVSKDDAASSFGEKDDDIPGNRPWDPEEREVGATVIQGESGDGPGPTNKARDARAQTTAINKAVVKALGDFGIIRRADAPAPGLGPTGAYHADSRIEKAVTVEDAQAEIASKSFREIARLRVAAGDLPAGIF